MSFRLRYRSFAACDTTGTGSDGDIMFTSAGSGSVESSRSHSRVCSCPPSVYTTRATRSPPGPEPVEGERSSRTAGAFSLMTLPFARTSSAMPS